MSLLYPVLVWLMEMRAQMADNTNIITSDDSGFQEQLDKLELPTASMELVLRIVLALAIVAAAAALVLLFRWQVQPLPPGPGRRFGAGAGQPQVLCRAYPAAVPGISAHVPGQGAGV